MIHVIGPRDENRFSCPLVNTTSKSTNWSKGLSPFFLGPVHYRNIHAKNVENGWQYSKVYQGYTNPDGTPSEKWFAWSKAGFQKEWADRYPMGKGAKPLYSYLGPYGDFDEAEQLGYIDARIKIYVTLYSQAVVKSQAWKTLYELYEKEGELTLWDFDGYDYEKMGMTLEDVLRYDKRPMGHAFVLADMLMDVAP